MSQLAGRVAVVAGGTRGGGRGIAVELGSAGATVYVTGRSVPGAPATPGRPETITETAELVDQAGGLGIAVQVDHTDPAQVANFFERLANEQQGRLDILVNDVWGGDALTAWGQRFWEHDLADGLAMQQRGVHSHIITSHAGAQLMVELGAGVIFEISDGVDDRYRGNLYYDLTKVSTNRLALAMAHDLHGTGVNALAVTPGFMRSEAVLEHFGLRETDWRDTSNQQWVAAGGLFSETPRYLGRAVAALAADPEVAERGGQALTAGNVARHYGFTDVDGRQPDMHAALKHLFDVGAWPEPPP